MIAYNELLRKKSKKGLIKVAVVGAGWFGSGLVREIYRWPGIIPRLVIDKAVDKAALALIKSGVLKNEIIQVSSPQEYNSLPLNGHYVVSDNTEIIRYLKGIDVIYEATGDIELGAKTALWAIEQGIHFITVNAEMDGTVGYILSRFAKQKNIVYSNSDGDQPGVLATMINEIKLLGFDIVVAGNCKGFIDYHKTPADIKDWVREGHNPRRVTSFTDGTKQSLELTVLANASGLVPDKRGMHGPITSKEKLVDDFVKIISREGIVDYVMGINGINQGAGVFVVAKRDDKIVLKDMDYLKKGNGPYYLFFRDHHLCYFEAPKSIADAVLFNIPTIDPKSKVADTFAVAKRDLKRGEKLDGIGGYMVYGLIDRAEIIREQNLLPIGLSEHAILTRNVDRDIPISYDMVDFPKDNMVLELRKQEDNITKRCTDEKNVV
jgi:predicted homoserine dehydrogenase-like protein